MQKVQFSEVQHFRGNTLWTTLLFLPVVIFLGVLIYQLSTGKLLGDRPMSNTSLIIITSCMLVPIIWAERTVKLTTIIDDEKISYGWNMPTAELNEIKFGDIQEWSVIKYTFVGYGFRLSIKYGSVHNLSGNKGLQIITKSGDKVLIGTHREEELKSVIEKIKIG
jgi:hypothetical protein